MLKTTSCAPRPASNIRRGGALLIAIIAVVVLAGMTTAMLTISTANQRENRSAVDRVQAFYVAEAGLSRGIAALEAGAPQAFFGAAGAPVQFSGGGFWGSSVDNGDGTWTITSFGTADRLQRGIEAVLVAGSNPIYANALFAGNSSGDAGYSLDFGGCGTSADFIDGPVYSGNDITLSCDGSISGTARANGTLTGMAGEEGITQPIPDMPAMNYPLNHDFDVAALFGGAAQGSMSGGGTAYQMPETSPAHIFRKNPDDRSAETAGTAKDDYFLEDPYEAVNGSSTIGPSGGAKISLSGLGGKPGPDGNEAVYYIDGNLWIHNRSMYSFTLANSGPEAVKLTIVVRGNIYISDNIFYEDEQNDGLALIAIKDSAEPDSGNIYFGDPVYGTLEYMDAFMFAENDFLDTNLSASGSATVTVHGNMTAGNQVKIDRDFEGAHSKLTVDFDERIVNSSISLPGLPAATAGVSGWTVGSWREVAVP